MQRQRHRAAASRSVIALTLLAASIGAQPAAAQTSEPTIVMRRPLPNTARDLTQNTCTGPGCTTNQTPPDDPSTGTPGGDASDPPGFSYNPDVATTPGEPNPPFGIAQWVPGPWIGGPPTGTPQCGVQARYTRQLSCMVTPIDFGGVNASNDAGPRPEIGLAAYQGGEAHIVSAIYDPDQRDATIVKAQLGGFGLPLAPVAVPAAVCASSAGPPPPNVYVGDQGECSYQNAETDPGAWQIDDSNQSPTCSAQAYRIPTRSCTGPDGGPGDPQLCLENVRNGGTRNVEQSAPVYGNFAGCRSGWVGEASDLYCLDANGNKGPDHRAYMTYQCVRSDGSVLPDAQCADKPKPVSGPRVVGACTKRFNFAFVNQTCRVGDSQENLIGTLDIAQSQITDGVTANRYCLSAGATCCVIRQVSTTNYSLADDGQYQVVAGKVPYQHSMQFYYDENDFKARPQSIEEGPYFFTVGGYVDYEQQEGVSNDDPDDILGGRPIQSGGGGPF